MSRVLGLDWGTQRIGVAISDNRNVFAVGYAIWPAEEPEFYQKLEQAVLDEDVGDIVVGYPLTLKGEVGAAARAVDEFVLGLIARGYVVKKFDERYTTEDASRSLSEIGISQRKQRGKIDMSAAVLMLQGYLDTVRGQEK